MPHSLAEAEITDTIATPTGLIKRPAETLFALPKRCFHLFPQNDVPGQVGEGLDRFDIPLAVVLRLVADAEHGHDPIVAQDGHHQLAHDRGMAGRQALAVRERA